MQQRSVAEHAVTNTRLWAERLLKAPGGSLWALQLMREQLLLVPLEQGDLIADCESNANTFASRLVDAARAKHGDLVADTVAQAWGGARFIHSCGKWVPGCTVVKEVLLIISNAIYCCHYVVNIGSKQVIVTASCSDTKCVSQTEIACQTEVVRWVTHTTSVYYL